MCTLKSVKIYEPLASSEAIEFLGAYIRWRLGDHPNQRKINTPVVSIYRDSPAEGQGPLLILASFLFFLRESGLVIDVNWKYWPACNDLKKNWLALFALLEMNIVS